MEKKYKKWDEIVNPALERTRKRRVPGPFEEEIARTFGLDDDQREGGEIVTIVDDGSNGETESGDSDREAITSDPVSTNSSDTFRTEKYPSGEMRPERPPSGLDRWSETPAMQERRAGPKVIQRVEPELTEEELRIKEEKKKKIESVMDEFVNWKESL